MKKCLLIIFILCNSLRASELWDLNYSNVDLSKFTVNQKKLAISYGLAALPPENWEKQYRDLKSKGMEKNKFPFQWKLVDLSSGIVLSESLNTKKLFYGASTTKIIVGSTFLQKVENPFESKYFQDLLEMIIVSSNPAWRRIQFACGNEDIEQGRMEVHLFTQGLGLERTRAYWGYSSMMNGLHGNEINVEEFVDFMSKLYFGEFYGSELIFKLMLAGQKGYDMSKRFLPEDVLIANKGGRYDGKTTNPDTGESTNPDGSPFTVKVRHQALFLQKDGKDYLMVIMSDLGKELDLSIMAYGLYKEFINQ